MEERDSSSEREIRKMRKTGSRRTKAEYRN
jgi:hypothetical protein